MTHQTEKPQQSFAQVIADLAGDNGGSYQLLITELGRLMIIEPPLSHDQVVQRLTDVANGLKLWAAKHAAKAKEQPPVDEATLYDQIKKLAPEDRAGLRDLISRIEGQRPPEKPFRPTAEELASVTVDIKLALFIVGNLAINEDIRLKPWTALNTEPCDLLMYVIDDTRRAIREAMTSVDLTELEWLSKANWVRAEAGNAT